jgi:hypothetical protein
LVLPGRDRSDRQRASGAAPRRPLAEDFPLSHQPG